MTYVKQVLQGPPKHKSHKFQANIIFNEVSFLSVRDTECHSFPSHHFPHFHLNLACYSYVFQFYKVFEGRAVVWETVKTYGFKTIQEQD